MTRRDVLREGRIEPAGGSKRRTLSVDAQVAIHFPGRDVTDVVVPLFTLGFDEVLKNVIAQRLGECLAGIGLEVMDVHAACRTYNILVAEERKVAAALLFE